MSKIQLTDRVLYSDGDSVVPVDKIMSLLSSGIKTDGLYVDTITDDITQFNNLVTKTEQITVKTETRPNDISWILPQEYAEIDPIDYTIEEFNNVMVNEGHGHTKQKYARLLRELSMYQEMKLLPVLRVLIYIINTLRGKNVVWGVGRGSSVSSYVLYILGVHDVDSVDYDLDIHDFLRL